METHTLRAMGAQIKTDGQRESLSFPPFLPHSLSPKCMIFHTHTHLLTNTRTHTALYPLLRQKTLDYSANGCTTDHRPALLQTGLLCGLSVGWKCCRGPRQCACGGLKYSACVCVLSVSVHTHPRLRSAPMLRSLTRGQVSH